MDEEAAEVRSGESSPFSRAAVCNHVFSNYNSILRQLASNCGELYKYVMFRVLSNCVVNRDCLSQPDCGMYVILSFPTPNE